MSENEIQNRNRVSRRQFFGTAAAGGGALLGLGLIASPASASGKLPQKAVQYQPMPKHGNRCVDCGLWQLPASCKAVEGPISPAGWCSLYTPKK